MKCDETRKFSLYVVLSLLLLLRSADYMSTFTGPRCGPCTRLNRECDWHHRWNFSDATPTVQVRFQNVVKKEGNVVWDPKAAQERNRGPLPLSDHLPDFSVLTSDEDRERKAVVHKPGTFGVVVTPDSFRDLPEYATGGRSSSFRSRRGGSGRPGSAIGRSVALPIDTNTVILDKFEDVSPVTVASFSSPGGGRSEDFGEHMQRLSITSPPPPAPYIPSVIMAPICPTVSQDHHLLQHFRNYIVPRLVQPQADGTISQGSTRDVLEREALRFPPLHHAICAISALHLAYNGQSSLAEAMQHYHQALAVSSTTTTSSNINNDLLSDGVFFRHYLLFVYDICIPVQSDDAGTDMSAEHLDHLRRIAVHRHHHFGGREPHAYTIWSICQLDVYACLMGSGSCEFVQTIVRNHMLPALEHQVPSYDTPGGAVLPPHETSIFPAILRLHEGIVLRAARIAQIAQMLRGEYSAVLHTCSINNHNYIHNDHDNDSKQNPSSSIPIPQEKYLRWIAMITQARTDLHDFWSRALPGYLASSSSSTLNNNNFLPTRVQAVFESATLLYHAMMIYSWTSMFPRQRWYYCYYYSAAVISSSLAEGGGARRRGTTTVQSSSKKERERKERRRRTSSSSSSSARTTAISPTAAPAATASTTTGIEAHITSILTLATRQIHHHHHHHQERGAVERGRGRGRAGSLNRQNLVFALFIAGVAAATTTTTTVTTVTTTAANENEKKQKKQTWKNQAINLIRVLEGYGGIGQNTFRMRRLLERVFEKLEKEEEEEEEEEKDVDWLAVAREMGLGAVGNCGL